MPKIRAKRLKSDWGEIAPTGSPNSPFFASLYDSPPPLFPPEKDKACIKNVVGRVLQKTH